MPHSDHSPAPPRDAFRDLPPFPDNVPTAPLLRISLEKLLRHDPDEEERCWKACCELGFFYLDMRTSNGQSIDGEALLQDADRLFDVMKDFYDLDVVEKVKYDFKEQGSYFGYKGYGEGIIDKQGTRDKNEFYNISKDDILALSPPLPCPPILTPHRHLYASYTRSSHALCALILSLLSSRLPSHPDLPSLHALTAHSGDQIRFVKAPAQDHSLAGVALGEHTDFGSVTVLFNRLGGLQVKLPDGVEPVPPASTTPAPTAIENDLCKNGWTYIRPLPEHAIINLGDALVKFSKGILRSNVHRVVAPPGMQGQETRWSLVYFCRPADQVVLRSLVGGEEDEEEEEVTAKEWVLRRALGRRRVGGWEESLGTERGMRV
ncbi:hypothetical protein HBI26_009650 [Parastagonospora nodorum]|nr:hypothetical protein HBI26_009650 [Parastagonospora nodorum]KAH5769257.1 hypothetical protein HBI97_161460 [Parastagonospora nodorum]KAH5801020.1 hypothetical protein HBI96_146660 [Parastagonospora nodorum]KAH5815592.1 hypothetical protein HBI94_129520 [Parastagonospora nodorum]KAH5820874.1 hypothetical protein HBI93_176720 [Parastagonospora nodorum]